MTQRRAARRKPRGDSQESYKELKTIKSGAHEVCGSAVRGAVRAQASALALPLRFRFALAGAPGLSTAPRAYSAFAPFSLGRSGRAPNPQARRATEGHRPVTDARLAAVLRTARVAPWPHTAVCGQGR